MCPFPGKDNGRKLPRKFPKMKRCGNINMVLYLWYNEHKF